jgi:hypothetical protein
MMQLSKGLVGGNPDGGGKIEGPQGVIGETGQLEPEGVADLPVKGAGAPVALVSEEKAVSGMEGRIPEGAFRMGGEEPDSGGASGGGPEGIPGVMAVEVQLTPVIHSATPEVAVLEGKAEGPHEVKAGSGEGTHPADVSRILGNFGFVEDDMQLRIQGR